MLSSLLERLLMRAKTTSLSQTATHLGVVGGCHRIVRTKVPFFAVLLRSEIVRHSQVPLQHFQLYPVFKANDMVRKHRLFNRNRRLKYLLIFFQILQSAINKLHQLGKVIMVNSIVANKASHYLRGQSNQFVFHSIPVYSLEC